MYTFCVDGEFREEADPTYTLELEWLSDWRVGGINRYIVANDGQTVAFSLTSHSTITGTKVNWAGNLKLVAPNAGGEVRETEMSSQTFDIIGTPVVTYP